MHVSRPNSTHWWLIGPNNYVDTVSAALSPFFLVSADGPTSFSLCAMWNTCVTTAIPLNNAECFVQHYVGGFAAHSGSFCMSCISRGISPNSVTTMRAHLMQFAAFA